MHPAGAPIFELHRVPIAFELKRLECGPTGKDTEAIVRLNGRALAKMGSGGLNIQGLLSRPDGHRPQQPSGP